MVDDQFGLFSLSLPGVDFSYEGQKPLFTNVDFGIDMESRSKSHMPVEIMTSGLIMVKKYTQENVVNFLLFQYVLLGPMELEKVHSSCFWLEN